MKITASNTQQVTQNLAKTTNQAFQEKMKVSDNPSFQARLGDGLRNVANVQQDAAELAKNFELGTENDIAKVMVSQQVSSLAFQLTLNVRNKALSAYKDIMNMPV
jgi:flagellar hook-basal body complex protein FliE